MSCKIAVIEPNPISSLLEKVAPWDPNTKVVAQNSMKTA